MSHDRKGFPKALLILLILQATAGIAQSLLFPSDYLFDMRRQAIILQDTIGREHMSLQPSLYKTPVPDTLKSIRYQDDAFFDKLFYENLIQVRHIDRSSGYDRKFNFDINPIVGFSSGKDIADTSRTKLQTNTRGFWIRGELGKRLYFESAFTENQSFFPAYFSSYAKTLAVVPGQGRYKGFKIGGYDYAAAYGLLQFKITDNALVRFGHGKQKVGNGYRSLLLSDNAFNYPYFQFVLSLFGKRVQLSQTWAVLMNLNTGGAKTPPNTEPIFQKKPATFQHLSWRPNRHFDVYLFQGTIWKGSDTNNRIKLDPLFFNPVIGSNLAAFGFNNTNHILFGGGFELRLFKRVSYYTQGMYDGVYTDLTKGAPVQKPNWGIQNGLKYFHAFGIKNLHLQFEYNILQGQPYYKPTRSSEAQSYANSNQSLASPAVLHNEMVTLASYEFKKMFLQLKQNYFSDFTSGRRISCTDMRFGYMFNRHYNLNLSVGCFLRSQDDDIANKKLGITQVIYFSLRTSIYNIYNDF